MPASDRAIASDTSAACHNEETAALTPTSVDAERFVRDLYQGILRREPEPGAALHWVRQIERGVGVNEVIDAFLNSAEYKNQRARGRLAYPPGHFYSPIVDPSEIAPRFQDGLRRPVPQSLPGIATNLAAQTGLWHRMLPFLREIPFPDHPAPGFRYHFMNGNYGRGDGCILYAMLRLFAPRRLIEIGSGYSSGCSLDTIDRYLPGRVQVTFIEPYAGLLREVLGEDGLRQVRLLEHPVQAVDLDLFSALERNDILFIDSTHVMKTGSDVCREVFEILPSLASGVLIHFHDTFWPFEYGEQWVLKENRSWNEIYGLRAFLMYNSAFEITFFNDYFRRFQKELIMGSYPKFLENSGGSLWLRKM